MAHVLFSFLCFPSLLIGLETYRSSYFGNTTEGPIYLNRLFCSGDEENLLICYHSPFTESCTHNNDAGVKCYPGSKSGREREREGERERRWRRV